MVPLKLAARRRLSSVLCSEPMSTSFVTITDIKTGEGPGFWMRDAILELWLRLLSLHLPEPTDAGENVATTEIRNRWLLASRGYFNGFVPHNMEFACSSAEGTGVVRAAIESFLESLNQSDAPLDSETLNLLSIEGGKFTTPIDRQVLRDVAYAFLDLLDGKIHDTAKSTKVMPGSLPYQRSIA
jgi:hypothetical protein